jgi:hypothetical protein
LSAEARTSVVRNRSGWTADASRDDRCPPFGIEPPAVVDKAVMTALLFDVLDTGFGRRTARCGIAP